VTPVDQIRDYVVGINKRRVGVLLLLVLVLLALGIGGLDDGEDGNNLNLLPESELEITEATPTPVTTATPTPTPGGGGGGDGAGDGTAGDGDGSNSDDIRIAETDDSQSDTDGDDGTNGDDSQNGGEGTATTSQSEDDYDGHLYLEVVGDRLRVEATNVLPGDAGNESATLKNNGTVNGTLLAAFDNVTDDENGLTEPELEAGDDGSDGELSEHLRVRLSVDTGDGAEEYLFGNETEYVRLSDIEEGTNMTDGVLDADENATVTLDWKLPKETGNEVQSDRVTFDLIFHLIHNEQGV